MNMTIKNPIIFNNLITLSLEGPLDVDKLEYAFHQLIERHEKANKVFVRFLVMGWVLGLFLVGFFRRRLFGFLVSYGITEKLLFNSFSPVNNQIILTKGGLKQNYTSTNLVCASTE